MNYRRTESGCLICPDASTISKMQLRECSGVPNIANTSELACYFIYLTLETRKGISIANLVSLFSDSEFSVAFIY